MRLLLLAGVALASSLIVSGCDRIQRRFSEARAAHALNTGNYAAALARLRSLSKADDPKAQFALAAMYAQGQGVRRDWETAARWNREAADQGLGRAQYAMGVQYAVGKGVPRNQLQAHEWFDLAATADTDGSQQIRLLATHARDVVARRLTPTELKQSSAMESEWRSLHPTVRDHGG